MALVSVVIPAYNSEKTILGTINSVLNQTFSDFEIVVINDGSPDKTLSLLSTISDPRLKVFSYENGGLPVARNRGIRNATGEFIAFLDGDDLWTTDKLEAQLAALQNNPNAGVAYSWTQFIDENNNLLYLQPPVYLQGDIYRELLISNFISSGSNIMVRRHYIDRVGDFDPLLKVVADWDYYLRLSRECPFVLVPQYQVLYRKTFQSLSSKIDLMERESIDIIDRAFRDCPPELQFLKKESLSLTYQYLSELTLLNFSTHQDLKEGAKKLAKAIGINPKIFLQSKTQRLFLKIIFLQLFPHQYSQKWIRLMGRFLPLVTVEQSKT